MSCEKHSWWFDTPCPKCAATITAPVTKPAGPPPLEPEPEIPAQNFPNASNSPPATPSSISGTPENTSSDDTNLPMPDFLLRNPDNTLAHPAPWGPLTPLIAHTAPKTEDPKALSDSVLSERLYDPDLSVSDRQKYILEATRRENKRKAYERIDKLKEAKQHRDTTDPTE